MKDNILYIVIPCYNEEDVLEETSKRLKVKMNKLVENKIISNKSKVLFVDDGLKYKKRKIIKSIKKKKK